MQANWSMQRRPARKPFERPTVQAPSASVAPMADPSHAALNGHVNGTHLNGAHASGLVNGGGTPRYDAAPAA